ncbi:unnamed protein product [Pleuronectes platessa]|uniref:Uncharacterized protein n=1 Tax=Pleuronectes platessa TaxID=8262 RepID=A0A9N7UK23_PLEPL|nr:unnamed protein product [Pleuronectes platessa]
MPGHRRLTLSSARLIGPSSSSSQACSGRHADDEEGNSSTLSPPPPASRSGKKLNPKFDPREWGRQCVNGSRLSVSIIKGLCFGLDQSLGSLCATGSSQTKVIVHLLCPCTSTSGLRGAPVKDTNFEMERKHTQHDVHPRPFGGQSPPPPFTPRLPPRADVVLPGSCPRGERQACLMCDETESSEPLRGSGSKGGRWGEEGYRQKMGVG